MSKLQPHQASLDRAAVLQERMVYNSQEYFFTVAGQNQFYPNFCSSSPSFLPRSARYSQQAPGEKKRVKPSGGLL